MEDFYTLQELAEKLGVTTRTVSRMIERGDLKEGEDYYRLGRALRFIKKAMVAKYHFEEK